VEERTPDLAGVDPDRVEAIPFPRQASAPLDVWDLTSAPGGQVYASLSPMHEPSPPQLYRLDAAGKRLDLVFDLRELTFLSPGTIPASKIHTSMAFADTETLYMVSHTTAPAPGHGVWAPVSCYHDLYEGFEGSHFLRLDLRSGDARSLGVPVPRESLWGGSCYLPEVGEYLAIGLVRGHLYSIRVRDMDVVDLGYVGRGCRLFKDGAGRAYGIAPVGRGARGIMYRYDPARGVVEDLDVALPRSHGASLAFARPGPDGRIYLVRNFYDPFWDLRAVVDEDTTDHVFAFDPETLGVEDLGSAFPGARDFAPPSAPIIPTRIVVGPTFLDDGNLYCGVLGGSLDGLVALLRWNVVAGAEPEFMGFLHVAGRPVPFVWDSVAGPDGRLYFAEASAGVFATRPELVAVDATSLEGPKERSPALGARFANPPGFDDEVHSRKERYAREADPHMGPRRVERIVLHDRLLWSGACAVEGMIGSVPLWTSRCAASPGTTTTPTSPPARPCGGSTSRYRRMSPSVSRRW